MNIKILYIFVLGIIPYTCFCQNAATVYNAGVTSYREGKFVQAQKNFQQALELAGDNTELSKRSQYNCAASSLQHAQEILPVEWDKKEKEIDSGILDQAMQATNQSIDTLNKFTLNYPDDQKAKAALKYAEALLKKLEEKKKQQEKDKQDKQDKKDKDKDKEKDKQDQNQDKKKQGQDKQDQSQDKQDQGSQKQDQKENDDSKEQEGEGESKDKEKVDQKKKDSDQDQGKRDRESKPDEPDDRDAKGNDQKPDHKQDENTEKNDTNEEHTHHPQPSQADGKQDDQEMQETENQNLESMEKRGLRAILENLQTDESKAQKRLLQYQTGQNKSPSTSGQKPW